MFGIKRKLYQPHLLPVSPCQCHTEHVAWQGADGVPECQGLWFGVSLFKYSHVLGSSVHSGVAEYWATLCWVPVWQGTCGQM